MLIEVTGKTTIILQKQTEKKNKKKKTTHTHTHTHTHEKKKEKKKKKTHKKKKKKKKKNTKIKLSNVYPNFHYILWVIMGSTLDRLVNIMVDCIKTLKGNAIFKSIVF